MRLTQSSTWYNIFNLHAHRKCVYFCGKNIFHKLIGRVIDDISSSIEIKEFFFVLISLFDAAVDNTNKTKLFSIYSNVAIVKHVTHGKTVRGPASVMLI